MINPLQADASFQHQPDWRSDGWHVGGCARLARAPSWWHHFWHPGVMCQLRYNSGTLCGEEIVRRNIGRFLPFCGLSAVWNTFGEKVVYLTFENEPTAPAQSRHTPHGSSVKNRQQCVEGVLGCGDQSFFQRRGGSLHGAMEQKPKRLRNWPEREIIPAKL